MVGPVKAIETIYKGYRFRSRLEARWAVFFDSLYEPEVWQYETEGYDLDGQWYLPDFYLPRLNCFIEIKGPEPSEGEDSLARKLRDLQGTAIAIFHGLPMENRGYLFAYDIGDSSGGSSEWPVELATNEFGALAFLTEHGYEHRAFLSDAAMSKSLPLFSGEAYATGLDDAALRAKQARFEHGERKRWK